MSAAGVAELWQCALVLQRPPRGGSGGDGGSTVDHSAGPARLLGNSSLSPPISDSVRALVFFLPLYCSQGHANLSGQEEDFVMLLGNTGTNCGGRGAAGGRRGAQWLLRVRTLSSENTVIVSVTHFLGKFSLSGITCFIEIK